MMPPPLAGSSRSRSASSSTPSWTLENRVSSFGSPIVSLKRTASITDASSCEIPGPFGMFGTSPVSAKYWR
jgi:hypothetical protein